METIEEAKRCIKDLHNSVLDGLQINVRKVNIYDQLLYIYDSLFFLFSALFLVLPSKFWRQVRAV